MKRNRQSNFLVMVVSGAALLVVGYIAGMWQQQQVYNFEACLTVEGTHVETDTYPGVLELSLVNPCNGTSFVVGNAEVFGKTTYAVSDDKSKLVYLEPGETKSDASIVVYSILERKEISRLTLEDIQSKFPDLVVQRNAALNNIFISDDADRIVTNFGYPLEADAEADIIVYNFENNLFEVLEEKGLLRGWFGSASILYEYPTVIPGDRGQFWPTVSRTATVSI